MHIVPRSCLTIYEDKTVSGSWDNPIKVWDSSAGKLLRILSVHTNRIKSVAVSTKIARFIILVSSSEDYSVIIWDLLDYAALRTIVQDTSIVYIAVSNQVHPYIAWLDSNKSIRILQLNLSVDDKGSEVKAVELLQTRSLGKICEDSTTMTCFQFHSPNITEKGAILNEEESTGNQ